MKRQLILILLVLILGIIIVTLVCINSKTVTKDIVKSKEIKNNETIKKPVEFWKSSTSEDFQIAGIGIDSTGSEVLKTLGEPKEKKQKTEPGVNNPDYDICWETWIYPDIEVVFVTGLEKGKPIPGIPDKVMEVNVFKGDYETKRGIKIGDPITKVVDMYGESDNYSYNGGGLINIGFYDNAEGKVSEIHIWGEFD